MVWALFTSTQAADYDFGKGHPFRGDRITSFLKLFESLYPRYKPYIEHRQVVMSELPLPKADDILKMVHSEEYIQKVRELAQKRQSLTLDTPLSPTIVQTATLALQADAYIIQTYFPQPNEDATYDGLTLFGGFHHASYDQGGGFCVFNDVALIAKILTQQMSYKRVLILDLDAHAGDGTEKIFWNDPHVMVISVHQNPINFYPGFGFVDQMGAHKNIVNVPLDPYASDRDWLTVFEEIIIPIVQYFKPEVIIRNGGSDPHCQDPLTDMGLTIRGFYELHQKVRDLADKVVKHGRIIDLIGSGYNIGVLAKTWLAILSGMAKAPFFSDFSDSCPYINPDKLHQHTIDVISQVKKAHSEKFVEA